MAKSKPYIGVDLSHWNEGVDYTTLSRSIDFAFVQEGYGQKRNALYLIHVNALRALRVPILGVYHFIYSLTVDDARAEARSCIASIQAAGLAKDIYVFADLEYHSLETALEKGVKLGAKEINDFTSAFCEVIEAAGYKAGIYTNLDFIHTWYTADTLEGRPLWLAAYDVSEPPRKCLIWQKTDEGRIEGCAGKFDIDIYYGDLPEDKEEKHMIANSGSDENGSYKNGQAGDQTGREWQVRTWYSYPWDCVLRHPDEKVREAIAANAEAAAANDNIGYDQYQRRSFYDQLALAGWDPSKITRACESDCSAGVIACTIAAGHQLGVDTLKNLNPDGYTGNMKASFRAAGFEVLTDRKYLTSPDYLLRGDILLNEQHHTATNLTTGSKAGCEGGACPVNLPAAEDKSKYLPGKVSIEVESMLVGAEHPQVKTIQRLLNALGYRGKNGLMLDIDGELGPNTAYAIESFQRANGMTGINFGSVAKKTWELLLNEK